MPTSFFFILLLLSCAPHHLNCTPTITHSRRILHQPFFPQDSLPPSQPPSSSSPPSLVPPTPKYPFSPSTPTNEPFFPSYPSPPPPPAPATFASFPANISSLSVPQNPKPKSASPKLVIFTVVALLCAVFLLVIALFSYCRRRRRRHFADNKSYRSENSHRLYPTNAETNSGRRDKLRTTTSATTSSEFLYLGTLVNSRGIDESANLGSRKLDSPELLPLPPLSRQNTTHNYRNVDVGSAGDDEDEEFYSPRGSSGGLESSSGGGSGSRRAFDATVVEHFVGCRSRSSDSTSCSCSSSTSGSPARSISISISPPVSLSPKSSRPKSPEHVAVQAQPPPPPPRPPPPPPPPSSSFTTQLPERGFEKSPVTSPRVSNVSSQNGQSPRVSNVSDQSSQSPAKVGSPFQQHVSVPPPPPPPLPPQSRWETPLPSPQIAQAISKPPVLITPSRPFVFQNPTKVSLSPVELPPNSEHGEKSEETPKPKLKPLHWDKVRASSDREMVWDQLKSSSFKLNEEMIETLFVVNTTNSNSKEATRRSVLPPPNQENRVLDPKKSQNIAILLRALNVTTEEVCEALLEGNADMLGTELLESLLKMAPTKEEERKLQEYKDDSPFKLGPAERFLKAMLDIPYAFKRVDAMLYIANFESEVEYLKKSFETLEAACEELRNSRMFLKLLEAVLKTGNRMNVGTNRGDAHAFKLDTLLKLADVKGADGKTTLLHFVVQEIIRTEGARLSSSNETPKSTINEDAKCRKLGLQVVSSLSSELTNVKKAAAMDSDVLSSDVLKLSGGIGNIGEVVRLVEAMGSDENSRKFSESMNRFMKMAEEEIIRIQAQESVALSLVKEITEYFHGNSAKEEAHPFRIFMVVRDFLTVLDRVCKEVGMINERTIVSSAHKFPVPVNPTLPTAFPGSHGRKQYSSGSSDDDGGSSP